MGGEAQRGVVDECVNEACVFLIGIWGGRSHPLWYKAVKGIHQRDHEGEPYSGRGSAALSGSEKW